MATNKLASDDDNPDFAGAKNPDRALTVRFHSMPLQNQFKTDKEGRPIFEDVDMVEIMASGDPLSIICQPVREDHKRRFPLHWAHYQNTHGGDTKEVGTPLTQWPRLSPAQVEELRALKVYTVENVAAMPDAGLQRIGMIAGTSPHVFRDHAIRFLAVAKDDSIAQAAEERVKALEAENAKLREDTQKQLDDMKALIAQATAPRKRGPKPKHDTGVLGKL